MDEGAGPAFLSDLTHEGALPLSLRFLERQGGDFCSPTAEMPQPSQRTRKAGPAALRVTPAMEAGISNHVWSIEELCSLLPPERVSSARRMENNLVLKALGE